MPGVDKEEIFPDTIIINEREVNSIKAIDDNSNIVTLAHTIDTVNKVLHAINK